MTAETATKTEKTTKPAKTPKLRHVHQFDRTFPSDTRYQMCACGESRRADRVSDNPCVQLWGFGPDGKTCGDCAHLLVLQQSRRWYKCGLRHDLTHSHKTDQLRRWQACGRFVEGQPEFVATIR